MQTSNELSVDHIKGAEQSLAILKAYMSGQVEHEKNDIQWHFRRTRLCLDKAEGVFLGTKSGRDAEPPLLPADVLRLRECLAQLLKGETTALQSAKGLFGKAQHESNGKAIERVLRLLDEQQ